jgi:N6-adenosine-specific RNA methylase IME4
MTWEGLYLRNNTEHAILATRGRPMVPECPVTSSWYRWPRLRHSEKPPLFFDIVEQVSPGPYVELFARAPRLGWDSWGYGYEGVA